jgi:hypothetical protein
MTIRKAIEKKIRVTAYESGLTPYVKPDNLVECRLLPYSESKLQIRSIRHLHGHKSKLWIQHCTDSFFAIGVVAVNDSSITETA